MAIDIEKLRQLKDDGIARHQQIQAEAEPEETSFLSGIQETFSHAADSVSEAAGNAAEWAEDTLNDAAEWAGNVWEKAENATDSYRDFLHEGSHLQSSFSPEAIRRANETGDYSGLQSSVTNLQQSAKDTQEAAQAAGRAMMSPAMDRITDLVNESADDPDSMVQAQAQAIRRSDTFLSFFMTPEEKLQKANEIEKETGIPADAILSDDEAFKAALRVSEYEDKISRLNPNQEVVQEALWEEFPELKTIASTNSKEAALALHDIESVRQSKSVIETFQKFWEIGNKQLEHDRLGYKLAMGQATDDDKKRLEVLQKELAQTDAENYSLLENPALAIASGVAQSGPLMWDGIVEAVREGSIAASAAMVAGAAAGTAIAGPAGTLPGGAVTGTSAFLYGMGRSVLANASRRAIVAAAFGAGASTGGWESIREQDYGSAYLDYINMKGLDGKPLMTEDEARKYAMVRSALTATLEMGPVGVFGRMILPGSAAKQMIKYFVSNAEEQAARKLALNFAKERAGAVAKIAGAEMAEEAAQGAVGDIIHNDIVANSRPSEYETYSAGDILKRSVTQAMEAAPAALGFGIVGGIGGAAVRTPGLRRDIRRAAEYRAKYDEQERETLNGVMMVEQLQQVISESKLKDSSPETQRKILRAQLAGTRYETAYIDVEMALKDENGIESLKEIGKAAGYTTEDIETAAMEHGHLAVPVEVLAQEPAGKSVRNAVSFSSDADSIARMEETKKEIRKELDARQREAVEAQMEAIRSVTQTWFPVREGMSHEDHLKAQSEQDMAQAAIYHNIENPYEGWKALRAEIEAEQAEILAPALNALREGMGKGGILIDVTNENDRTETRRVSENDQWHRDWYKEHKRPPTEAEMIELARLVTIGDPTAPKLLNFTPMTEEEAEGMAESAAALDAIRRNLQTLDEIKGRMQRLDSLEMELTQGFSPEAYEVYRRIVSDLEEAGGRPARAARISAAIFARHADIVADIHRNNGDKEYTALDYAKSYRLGMAVKEGYAQSARTTEEKLNNDEKAWIREIDEFISEPHKAQWGRTNARKLIDVMDMPLVLQMLGAPNERLHAEGKLFVHSVRPKHPGMTYDILKQIPRAITEPLMVLKGNHQNSMVIVTNIIDENGATIIVPVEIRLSQKETGRVVNIISTVFAKTKKEDQQTPDYEWFANRLLDEKNSVLYLDKKKSTNWVKGTTSARGVDPKLSDAFDAFIVSHKIQNVKTENDLKQIKNSNQLLYQTGWHGTPYHFDKFTLDHIGSGEGAQAHGWGLYFAGDRKISEGYREKLSRRESRIVIDGVEYTRKEDKHGEPIYSKDGKELPRNRMTLELAVIEQFCNAGYNKEKAIEALRKSNEQLGKQEGKDFQKAIARNKKVIAKLEAADIKRENSGALYQVEIPEENVMLDEQKTFEEQPETVKAAIKELFESFAATEEDKVKLSKDKTLEMYHERWKGSQGTYSLLDKMEKDPGRKQRYVEDLYIIGAMDLFGLDEEKLLNDGKYLSDQKKSFEKRAAEFRTEVDKLLANVDAGEITKSMYEGKTGKQIYSNLSERLRTAKRASMALNDAGVKGIAYDGRKDGRCYVVFDDKAINVIEKYNQIVGIGARTANMEALNKAKEMEAKGKSRKEIWDSTGWLKGRDDKWRFEIPDNLDEIDLSDPEEISKGELRLGDIYKNPKLYEAYPELRRMYVYGKNMERGTYAAVEVSDGMPVSIVFNIDNLFDDKKINENKKSLVHEIQHIIQLKEGFAQGGSQKTRGFIERRISNINKYIDDVKGGREYLEALNKVNEMIFDGNTESKEYKNSVKELEDMAGTLGEGMCRKLERWEAWANEYRGIIENKSDFDVYWNLAGEEEARETANRAEKQSVIDRANRTISEAETNIEELAKSLSEEQQKEIRDFIKKKDFDNEDGWEVFDDYPDEIVSALADYMQDYENASRSDMPIPHSSSAIIYNGSEIALSMERSAASIQGRTSLMSNGTRIIELMETADESTFVHELGHVFLQDLDGLAEFDETSAKEKGIVDEWAGWKKGAAKEYAGTPWEAEFRQREQEIIDAEAAGDFDRADQLKRVWRQERFARGFEMYLKTGDVPARGLRKVFRKFKDFLKLIYHAFTGTGGKASPAVEAVMARMIATDQEIQAMKLDDRYKDLSAAGGDKLFDETASETYKRWQEEAEQQAKEKLLTMLLVDIQAAKQVEREKQLNLERRRMELELRQKDVYLAEAAAAAAGDEEIVLNWFNSVDEYRSEREKAGSAEDALEKHMEEYAAALDKEIMESHLTDEQITEAMESPVYRKKLIAMEAAIYEEKAAAMRKVSGQAKATIENIIDRIAALDGNAEISERSENPEVQGIFKEINKLRFSAKWKKDDLQRLDAMMKAENVDDLMKAANDFQRKADPKEEKPGQRKADTNKAGWEAYAKANEGMIKAYAEEARRKMAGRKISEACSYATYRKLERQAAKRSEQMAKAGRWDMAVQQKRMQAQYAALAHEAKKNQERVKKTIDKIRRMAGAKSVKLPKEERYWLRHLAYLLRVTDHDAPMPEGGVGKLSDLTKEMEEQLEIDYHLEDLLDETTKEGFAGYQSMTMNGLDGAADALTAIYTKGKDKWNLKTVRGRSIADVVDEIMGDYTAYNASKVIRRAIADDQGGVGYADTLAKIPMIGEKLAQLNQKELSLLLKPEVMLEMLGKKAHKYIYGTYDEAATKEGRMREAAQKQLEALLEPYSMKERREWKDKIIKTYDGGRLTKENIICMALNWGNDVNRQRLVGGIGGTVDVQGLLESYMTKKDWELVQGVWDFLDTYWKDTCEVEEKLNGVTLEKQKPKAFEIRTADGETVKLSGGYYHIKYNPEKSSAAEVQEANTLAMSSAAGSRVLGMGRAHTKARSEFDIVDRPLLLEFSVLTEQLDNVIHNICWRLAVRDVLRLVTDVRLTRHIESTLGRPFSAELRKWAEDCWKVAPSMENSADRQLGSLVGKLRGNAVFAIMAYRIWPAVENVSNIGPMADKLGIVDTVSAISEFYSDFNGNAGKLRRSSFMQGRINSMDRDLKAQGGLFDVTYTPLEVLKRHAYDLLVYTDLSLSAPLWCKVHKNAYGEKLAEVKQEVQDNIAELEKARAESDALHGELRNLQIDLTNIDTELEARKSSRPPGDAEHSLLSGYSKTELFEVMTEKKERLKEVKRELVKATNKLEMAAELPMWSDEEIIMEADKRAVAEADKAIRDVFGSGMVKDQSSVQRSKNELVKLLTTFYSFFNTQFNAMAESYYKGKKMRLDGWGGMSHWAPFAKSVMFRVVLTATIGTALRFALGLAGDDDEKKKVKDENGKEIKVPVPMSEQYAKELARNLLSTAAGGIPIFRDIMNFAMNEILTGNSYGRSGPEFGSVMTRGMEQTIRGIRMIANKSEHNLKIEEKRAKEAERVRKMKPKQRKKWEEEQKYKKPDKPITNAAIARELLGGLTTVTAAQTGISGTLMDAFTTSMQYMLDTDDVFDPWGTGKAGVMPNWMWSIIFDKRPVERKPEERPEKKG